jgi:hypothetical protein
MALGRSTGPYLFALALALAARRGATTPSAPRAEEALAKSLSSVGLQCRAEDVEWLDFHYSLMGAMFGGTRAIVRAHLAGEPADLYLVEAKLSAGRTLLHIDSVRDITNTSGVDESRPIVRGHLVVYKTVADGAVTAVHVLDLAGRPPSSYTELTRVQRAQVQLTNLQQTGLTAGLVHTAFAFDPIARRADIEWQPDGDLQVRADGHGIVIDPREPQVVAGASFVRVVTDAQARPGSLVTWAVDRARASPWIGDDRMQWLKAVAFLVLDKVRAALFKKATTEDDVRRELGVSMASVPSSPNSDDAERGWPPAPIPPIVSPALAGEGHWITLEGDPFITPTENGPAAFATSFLRASARRQDERVYVTLWDPRQIAMHIEAGTVEPISATGEHGPGMIPRAPEVLTHLVAAFNGGFQAQHGEYGMVAHGIEYLGPKPYAATVMELRDGSNAFGAWPDSPVVPDDVVALRQNLTALVQNGSFNPWGRTWWGGAPPDWPDQIHSTRSAMCLTTEGFAGYFYSPSISAEDLARGMMAARCSFGIHLDMNPGHAGFEFYDVRPAADLPPLGRRLQPDWEAEGSVSGLPGYAFRSRRMIRAMGHMLFPRYIQRESRDFFYLTYRALLPGAALPSSLSPPERGEGIWHTMEVPQGGFPPAVATTWVRVETPARTTLRLLVVRADPRTMAPADQASADAPTVLSWNAPARGDLTLWWSPGLFAISPVQPGSNATALFGGHRETIGAPANNVQPGAEADRVQPSAEAGPVHPGAQADRVHLGAARAAVGVQDEDGMLLWVEVPPAAAADRATDQAMDSFLERLGCSTRMFVDGNARALPGGNRDAAGNLLPQPPEPAVARLVRAKAPAAHAAFEDTPIVPIQVWQPLQAKRVRYFLKVPK